jgi:hypothetical protein
MTADDRREELEATLWRAGINPAAVPRIIDAAERYAAARVTEEMDRYDGRARLAAATAEKFRRAS